METIDETERLFDYSVLIVSRGREAAHHQISSSYHALIAMNSPVKIKCPSCGSQLQLKDRSAAGKRVRCPKCSKAFELRAKPSSAGKQPGAARVSAKSTKPRRPAPPPDDDEFQDDLDPFASDDFEAEDEFDDEYSEDFDDDFGDEEFDDDYGPPAGPKTRKPRSSSDDAAPKKRKKKRKKKKKRKHSGPTDSWTLAIAKMLLGGFAGGAVAVGLWMAVAYSIGIEVAYMSLAIGLSVGFGVDAAGGHAFGGLAGGIGAALTAVFVLVGKISVFALVLANMSAYLADDPPPVTNEALVGVVADEVAKEWEGAGVPMEWPEVQEDDFDAEIFVAGERHFPANVWAEALIRWEATTPEQQEQLKADFLARYEDSGPEINPIAAFFSMPFFFYIWDLIWLVFSMGLAYMGSMGAWWEMIS